MKDNSNETDKSNASKQFSKVFQLVKNTLQVFDKMQVGFNELKFRRNNLSSYQIILLTNTAKAMGTLLSIEKLCNYGLIGDARSLLRKLLELTATLHYINRDQKVFDRRVNRFYHHGSIKLKKRLDDVIDDPDKYGQYINDGILKISKQILTSYDNAKRHFKPNKEGEINKKFLNNWDGKSLTKIIRQSGLDYEMATFDIFSESIHFSSADIATYIDFENSAIRTGIETDEIPYLLLKCLQYTCQILKFGNEEFNLNLTSDLQKLQDDINSRNSVLVRATGESAL